MNIGIVGAGYVGTVTATCLAELGHNVLCTDIRTARVETLQKGDIPFYEDGLEPLLKTNLEEGRLAFTSDLPATVKHADVLFLCISTPWLPNGKPDLKLLHQALKQIAESLGGHTIIAERSTLPIKSGQWLKDALKKEIPKTSTKASFEIVAAPHFLREGSAVADFFNPDRIIIGADSNDAANLLVDIFEPLNAPILITDIDSAELIKHATNAFLALKISFINSIAQLCEKTGADIQKVSRGLGLDKRISADYLQAGLGYGGVFFPKNIASLVNMGEEHHINLDLLKATDVINRYQRISFIERIVKALGGDVHGKTVAIWGLAYRPNTDDMRDAPAISIISGLQNRGAKIRTFDPLAMASSKEHIQKVTYCQDPYDAAKGADAIAILTEWDTLKKINFRELKESTKCRIIVDGRNLYTPRRMKDLGFEYFSIGR